MVKKVVKFIIIILILSVIFGFSNETGETSSKRSDGLIIKVAQLILNRQLSKDEKNNIVNKLVVPVRKTAHIIIYLLLGISIISFYREFTVINYKQLIISMVVCFILAIFDEIHQLFIVGRSGEIKDIIIDEVGSMLGIMSYYKLVLKGRKKYE